jgi:protein-L-isoaspartate(D-aspartate) O-methyltransferase
LWGTTPASLTRIARAERRVKKWLAPRLRLADSVRRFRGETRVPAERRGPDQMLDLQAQRDRLVTKIEASLGPFDPLQLQAVRVVPRERFVRAANVAESAEDVPLPLDDAGLATVSAPHAYLLSFRLLGLGPGDRLVELGSGSGYGAALASFIVGPRGRVLTVEIDAELAARARELLADLPGVTAVHGDAVASTPLWRDARKVVCTFAVKELPRAWLDALPNGGVLVAPVGAREGEQELVRVQREGDALHVTNHGGVRYVKNRSEVAT